VFQRRLGPNKWDVLTIHPDGSHLKIITYHPQLENTDPSWSPSGKYIVYSAGGACCVTYLLLEFCFTKEEQKLRPEPRRYKQC